jgi:hypothetical protein
MTATVNAIDIVQACRTFGATGRRAQSSADDRFLTAYSPNLK